MPRLPSRYEDLDAAFRGRLRPNPILIEAVNRAFASMQVSGGIRFLPVFGHSGSGKSSAALELATHLPEAEVAAVPRDAIGTQDRLHAFMASIWRRRDPPRLLIAVVDQYEEIVTSRTAVPTQFVEQLSLLDRGEFRAYPTLFIWLTTSTEFRGELVDATIRNRRILVDDRFELVGPGKTEWPAIIEETFEFHNNDEDLADYGVLLTDLETITDRVETLGLAIEAVGLRIASPSQRLQDLSEYRVAMLWPVTDGLRISRVQAQTNPREGYTLNWSAWYRELNPEDQRQLPLAEYNRTRLYFDMRLIPIAAADLHLLCRDLDIENAPLAPSYLERFKKSHFGSIMLDTWNPVDYSPMRERESARAEAASLWYQTVTGQPTLVGRRIARVLTAIGVPARHEQEVRTPHGSVRVDVLAQPAGRVGAGSKVIVELKVFSEANTMPSTIRDAVKVTMRRHAQLAGFLPRQ